MLTHDVLVDFARSMGAHYHIGRKPAHDRTRLRVGHPHWRCGGSHHDLEFVGGWGHRRGIRDPRLRYVANCIDVDTTRIHRILNLVSSHNCPRAIIAYLPSNTYNL